MPQIQNAFGKVSHLNDCEFLNSALHYFLYAFSEEVLEELIVSIFVKLLSILVLMQLSETEEGINKVLVVNHVDVFFYNSQHLFVLKALEQHLVEVSSLEVASRCQFLNNGTCNVWHVLELFFCDFEELDGLIACLQVVLDIGQVLLPCQIIEADLTS